MKSTRQSAILSLIKSIPVTTQEELVDLLNERGFNTTQATVSRDIKQLKLFKAANAEGISSYTQELVKDETSNSRLIRVLRDSFISINTSDNIAVIKTLPATASAVAAAIDSLDSLGLLGTIAGDDTIFACFESSDYTKEFHDYIINELRQ